MYFSETGANVFCVAPGENTSKDGRTNAALSGAAVQGIASLDRVGINGLDSSDYTNNNNIGEGTSIACPIASGVVALILEAEPRLTYRDVMHILANHSVQVDALDWVLQDAHVSNLPTFRQPSIMRELNRWQANGATPQRKHSVRYGFGKVDAAKSVVAAQSFVFAPAAMEVPVTINQTPMAIADATISDSGAGFGFGVSAMTVTNAPAGFVCEHVGLKVVMQHPRRGDIAFRLKSPSGSTTFIERRPGDDNVNLDFTFTSLAHWGETAINGTWVLTAYDLATGSNGQVLAWAVAFDGYVPYPTPTITASSITRIGVGSSARTVTVTGTGFSRNAANEVFMTQFRVGATPLMATWVSATEAQVTIPASLLTTAGTIAVTARNPDFNSQFTGTPGTYGTVTYQNAPVPVNIEVGPPVLTVTPTTSTVAFNGQPTFAITASDAVTGLDTSDLVVTNGNVASFSGSGASYTAVIAPSGPGLVTVGVRAGACLDAAGNASLASAVASVTVLTAATLTVNGANPTNFGVFGFTLTLPATATGLEATDVVVQLGTVVALTGSGTSWSITVTATADGLVDVSLPAGAFTYTGGAPSEAIRGSVTVDRIAPVLTLSGIPSPLTKGLAFTLTITSSEDLPGLDASKLTLTGATMGSVSGALRTFTVPVTVGTGTSISVTCAPGAARDAAGNQSAAVGPISSGISTDPVPTTTLPPATLSDSGGGSGGCGMGGLGFMTLASISLLVRRRRR